jgi:hypothetical protein
MKTKRMLKFSADVTCRTALHINDFTCEEIEACWYNGDDVELSRNEAQSIICLMEKGETLVKEDKGCTRGLEPFTSSGSHCKQVNRDFARSTVLGEQDRQCNQGLRDENELSRLYSICTFTCQAMAGMAGHDDAESVPEIGRNLAWLV